jgi:hypothetical protein
MFAHKKEPEQEVTTTGRFEIEQDAQVPYLEYTADVCPRSTCLASEFSGKDHSQFRRGGYHQIGCEQPKRRTGES